MFSTGLVVPVAAAAPGFGPVAARAIRTVVASRGRAALPFWSVVENGFDAAAASAPPGLVVSIPDATALGTSIRSAVESGISDGSMNSASEV